MKSAATREKVIKVVSRLETFEYNLCSENLQAINGNQTDLNIFIEYSSTYINIMGLFGNITLKYLNSIFLFKIAMLNMFLHENKLN